MKPERLRPTTMCSSPRSPLSIVDEQLRDAVPGERDRLRDHVATDRDPRIVTALRAKVAGFRSIDAWNLSDLKTARPTSTVCPRALCNWRCLLRMRARRGMRDATSEGSNIFRERDMRNHSGWDERDMRNDRSAQQHIPEASHDDRRDNRAWSGGNQDDDGGFGPGAQGPYGQSAYGQGSYARGTNSYVPGTNHPYADRDAHNRYNREHFPQGNYAAIGPRGPHRGKGPKNFVRSDERLTELVNELLMDHDEIDATHVNVEIKNGEVSVSGTVEDRWQRREIEDLIERMGGVKDVHISIKIASRTS
jgi:osmotically-inducible protein OsmY